jgi:hypothetical protein
LEAGYFPGSEGMTEKKSEYVRIKRKDREEEKAYIKSLEETFDKYIELLDFGILEAYFEYESERICLDFTIAEIAERHGIPRTTFSGKMQNLKKMALDIIKKRELTAEQLQALKLRAYGHILTKHGLLNHISPADLVMISIYRSPEFRKSFEKNKTWVPLIPKILELPINEIIGHDDGGQKQNV